MYDKTILMYEHVKSPTANVSTYMYTYVYIIFVKLSIHTKNKGKRIYNKY